MAGLEPKCQQHAEVGLYRVFVDCIGMLETRVENTVLFRVLRPGCVWHCFLFCRFGRWLREAVLRNGSSSSFSSSTLLTTAAFATVTAAATLATTTSSCIAITNTTVKMRRTRATINSNATGIDKSSLSFASLSSSSPSSLPSGSECRFCTADDEDSKLGRGAGLQARR